MKIEEKKLEEKCIVKEKKCSCEKSCEKKACKGKGKAKCSCKKKATTSVQVSYDVGWGNTLFIRGEGCGLNWDKGIPLKYDEKKAYWYWDCKAEKPIEFKLLINDETWSEGDNFVLNPGKTKKIKPLFL